ncbi:MAG: MBOAT family protein [Clostridia bacterium]|nr:MBOAT family protein [Clostridia bacterium]
MVFSSMDFLFVFLPVFFVFYYLLPQKFRHPCLLIGSIAFYTYGTLDQPLYILLFLASALVNWFVGLRIQAGKHRKAWLIVGLVYDFGWLFVFKYADFLFSSVQALLDTVVPTVGIALPGVNFVLPIGISFYTFQIVSYIVDVYKQSYEAERSWLKVSTYLYMFPQLIAGPIVTYSHMKDQLDRPTLSVAKVDEGLKDFTYGLGLKVLLANQIGNLWTDVASIGYDSISTPLAWMGVVAFSFQLYFDFYGYSLMAVGLGKLLGYDFPQNFRHPYVSKSMTEFWRRWHITLGTWFREYVYIPLGGNRKGTFATVRNMLVVWLFTGLWHGASWNFVLWGAVLFALLMLEKFLIGKWLNKYPVLGHAYMILIIPLTWLIFAVTDFSEMAIYFERLFPFLPGEPINVFAGDWLKYGKMYGILLLVGLAFSTEWPEKLYHRFKDTIWGTLVLLAVFWGSVYCLYLGLNDPFLYFRF